jgi:ferritin
MIKENHLIGGEMMDLLIAQYSREMHSAMVYFDLASYVESANYLGFSKFFQSRAAEELEHAHKFFTFICDGGGIARLETLESPHKFEDPTLIELFEKALEHEQYITDNIYKLKEFALANREHATDNFLIWFVEEQVEEEASLDVIITHLQRAEGNEAAVLEIEEGVNNFYGPMSPEEDEDFYPCKSFIPRRHRWVLSD